MSKMPHVVTHAIHTPSLPPTLVWLRQCSDGNIHPRGRQRGWRLRVGTPARAFASELEALGGIRKARAERAEYVTLPHSVGNASDERDGVEAQPNYDER